METPVGAGFLHRLDPRSKIAAVLVVSVSSFMVVRLEGVAILLAFIGGLWALGGLPLEPAYGCLRLVRNIGAFLVVTQSIWYPGSRVLWSPIIPRWLPVVGGSGSVTAEGLYWGVVSTGRLLVLLLAFPLLTATTPAGLLVIALVKMGVPYRTSYLATAALNLVPSIRDEAESIMQVQMLRGAEPVRGRGLAGLVRGYAAIALPLVAGCMRKAALVGIAMDARAFGSKAKRTFVRRIEMKRSDWMFMAACAAVAFLAVFLGGSGVMP
jgi:energy-coupling factor transport system permease protein